jgi:hypothetical protein
MHRDLSVSAGSGEEVGRGVLLWWDEAPERLGGFTEAWRKDLNRSVINANKRAEPWSIVGHGSDSATISGEGL